MKAPAVGCRSEVAHTLRRLVAPHLWCPPAEGKFCTTKLCTYQRYKFHRRKLGAIRTACVARSQVALTERRVAGAQMTRFAGGRLRRSSFLRYSRLSIQGETTPARNDSVIRPALACMKETLLRKRAFLVPHSSPLFRGCVAALELDKRVNSISWNDVRTRLVPEDPKTHGFFNIEAPRLLQLASRKIRRYSRHTVLRVAHDQVEKTNVGLRSIPCSFFSCGGR